jgi:DNA-binding NarL/FixJ family response regulator
MTPTKRLRVFITDDHAIVRDGLKAILARQPSVEVVGEAADGREAVKLIETLRPDVVLMDIAMPGLNGVEATRQVRKTVPRAKILILSAYSDQDDVYDLLRAGASGYVLKAAAAVDLLTAIEAIARGECYLSPAIADRVVGAFVGKSVVAKGVDEPGALTAREREVLQLIAEGCRTATAARRLGISPKTVETHRSNIASKLGIHDLPGLVKYAIKKGVVKLS